MSPKVPEGVLQRAVLELLTSSGAPRYAVRAKALAREAFPAALQTDSSAQRDLTARLVELIHIQSASEERGVEEFEAALILAALVEANAEDGGTILEELVAAPHVGLRWLTGMARELLRDRAATTPVTVPPLRTFVAAMRPALVASDDVIYGYAA